mmetsp:Transcript_100425/g.287390  ORF Transcript_100425/g.287390 Transcript_100425/m.287390 type:complete len:116 (+) Transcript_100425:1435-1782(+)
MARGNQRELAREKNAKKNAGGTKAGDTAANAGLTPEQRRERDARALAEKQARKAAAAAEDPDVAAAQQAASAQKKKAKANKTSSSNQAMNSMLKEGLKGAKQSAAEKKKVAKRKN